MLACVFFYAPHHVTTAIIFEKILAKKLRSLGKSKSNKPMHILIILARSDQLS